MTGVQRYASELCLSIKELFPDTIFVSHDGILHNELAEKLDAKIFGILRGHLWEQLELPKYLKTKGKPLLLNLANTAPLFYCNKISTVHDIAYERYPKSFSWKFRVLYQRMIPIILRNSRHIFTVSEFSKSEISDFYNVSDKDITVIYNAVSEAFRPIKTKFDDRFILAVSSLNYQKNFHSLIKAFNQLKLNDIKLYLIGGINRSFQDPSLLKEIESNKNIHFLGRVSDKELVEYYSAAQLFVYPSLYEGFGIPPLEAQACGCPCVISSVASLPEVGNDSVIYCDPYDISSIADSIYAVLKDNQLRADLISKGFENIKLFNWKTSAKRILEIVEEHK